MIVIGVCDGEQKVRSLLANYVNRYCEETGTELQLLSYSTGEKLLKNYLLDMDLIFLEIPLHKMSGLTIAQKIKQYDKKVRVVFLTTVLSYVLEAYEVGASNYLLKPLGYEKFCRELNFVLEEKQVMESRCFLERTRQGLYKIYFQDIRYIETSDKHTLIHTKGESISCLRKMKEFEKLFTGTYLVRCHTGYIVNLRYFKKLEEAMIILVDGSKIPVSRNRRLEVMNCIRKFYENGL